MRKDMAKSGLVFFWVFRAMHNIRLRIAMRIDSTNFALDTVLLTLRSELVGI